jgi:hypothetical protein
MDLKDGWEKKAILGLGVVVLVIILYAYFVPFSGTPNTNVSTNQGANPAQVVPVPFSQPVANNSTANNTTNNGNNNLTSDQAKNIALNANPGYTAGTPSFQNNTNINGTVYSVWVVPITQGNTIKTVYVDNTGRIIQTTG